MSKRKLKEINVDELRASFEAVAAQSIASFSAPRIPTKVLIERLGIPRSSLTNWLTNKAFELDADKHRDGNRDRLFSARDAVVLATAAQTSAIGLPLATAKALADHLVDHIKELMGTLHGFAMKTKVLIYRRPGEPEWQIVHYLVGASKVRTYSKGQWKLVSIDDLGSIPPMRVEFDVTEFVSGIVNELQAGFMMVVGDRHAIKRALDKAK